MARLAGSIVSEDETFKSQISAMLRSASVPVTVADGRFVRGGSPDVVVVDGRDQVDAAVSAVEKLRAADATSGIFFVSGESNPDIILRAMRAGANEFFAWPPTKEILDQAINRTATRRASTTTADPQATSIVFLGAKGGAGTTTMAVNFGVEVARLSNRSTMLVDLKPGLGEVSVFLGLRSRYTLLDALDNLHRLDSEFLRELVVKHKSGMEILAGSELFDRPGTSDTGALEEVYRLLARQYQVHHH